MQVYCAKITDNVKEADWELAGEYESDTLVVKVDDDDKEEVNSVKTN